MQPKLFLVGGKPFLATAEGQIHQNGRAVDVFNGYRPEQDPAQGGVALRQVLNLPRADAVKAAPDAALAALVLAVFGPGVALT